MTRNIECHRYLPLMFLAMLALAILACSAPGDADIQSGLATASLDDHSGHNHAPGEHGKVVNATADVQDWCAEHRVPESECTQCNPQLIVQFKASGDWCDGHSVPESHCRLCNPGIVFEQESTLHQAELDFSDDEIEISLFFRPNSGICATDGALIQFASAETAERSGITVTRTIASERKAIIEAPAEIVFDETREIVVTSSVSALVARWLIAAGDEVSAGDPMAMLQSPEMAHLEASLLSAQADYRVSEQEFARHESMREKELISAADFERQLALTEQTRADFNSAQGLLLSAGMSRIDVDELLSSKNISSQFTLRAPSDGLVVERIAQLGQLLDAGSAFAMIADPSSMWIEAKLTEQQLSHVTVGQSLTFASDGRGLDRVGGQIIWVSRFLDPHSRTGTVRAEVIDSQHGLQASGFGRVSIGIPDGSDVVLVPKGAVQWEGCCNVVFVKESIDRYRPRKIRFGAGAGPYYQVTSGLKPGEDVVVGGSFLLKTELKKTSLGTGCCGLEPTS
ncbi:MAG: efflux RND transporter periplasmic adaptor subunit [candidate division Zixibacteria bacterium]|nr:efflux RND transporter periplasmic adaptor subunit [candidate division Zixibacteria bacterium]MBU1471497.1 efflux RND transporter periplasmic adaptor subunit [candidate division Zixibacteria bacterium]MBU2625527.1 efflux RND transporter periplasmic adaptor subunit [candidate division Zixibacteria bacterium]